MSDKQVLQGVSCNEMLGEGEETRVGRLVGFVLLYSGGWHNGQQGVILIRVILFAGS